VLLFSLIIAGYLFLPLGYMLFERMGPTTAVSMAGSALVAISLAAVALTFRARRHFFFTLPLLAASLFLLVSVLFARFT